MQAERIAFLEAEIETLTNQMEAFGEEGEVEKASELLQRVELLKQNIEAIKNVSRAAWHKYVNTMILSFIIINIDVVVYIYMVFF